MLFALISLVIPLEAERESLDSFMVAIRNVLEDSSFEIKSQVAAEARKVAVDLLTWCSNDANVDKCYAFTTTLLKDLNQPILSCKKQFFNREKLWRKYFLLRSSEKFITQWVTFLKLADLSPTPILYQHLTDILFRKLLHNHCMISTHSGPLSSVITQREGNAIRYAAGFVCKRLQKKIERSKLDNKEEMVACLMALIKDKKSRTCGNSEEWTVRVNRGGLCRIKEATFNVFLAIEEELKECLKTLTEILKKDEIIERVTTNDDVEFYWLIATADFEIDIREVHQELLRKIVELYVTVRGFSFASAWLEKYKQKTKKSTQRSKSLRRDLYDGNI